ncbi:MAG: LacI family DNA-binding transcriptional regulator [Pseudomonadota bacterium]
MKQPSARSSAKVKLRDVAREAGVSVATVSRVINKSESVRLATRERIEATIAELGFTPNPLAKAFSAGRTRTVGAVIPTVGHAIFANFLNALEGELSALGYALVIATAGDDAQVECARVRALLEMGAEGIIVSGTAHEPELTAMVEGFGVPLVYTSVFDPDADRPTIGYDNAQLAAEAVEHLTGLGHRRIAVLHGPTAGNDRTRLRIDGAQRAAAAVPGTQVRLHQTELTEAAGVSAAQALLAEGPGVTAILCLSDVIALGVLFALARAGAHVPDQISVMGFDDLSWAQHAHPPLTAVHLPAERMGRTVGAALVRHLEEGVPIEPTLLDGRVFVRASTAPPRG